MLPDSALASMKVMVATPCYISSVSMKYVTSLFDLAMHAPRFGLDCVLHMHSESLLTRGRNKMVIKFLQDESFTHLFWIDSDLAFRPGSVCRLLLADRDVAAAAYPLKMSEWPESGLPGPMTRQMFEDRFTPHPFFPHGSEAQPIGAHVDENGFIEVTQAQNGFLCIKRDVLLAMMKHYPELNYTPDGPPNNPEAPLHFLIFDTMVDPDTGRYLSEDFAFCRRWRDMGGRIFLDTQVKLDHLGQYNFRGDLAESLRVQGKW